MDGLAQGFPGQQLFLCRTDWHHLIIILETIFFLFLTFLLISQETRGWPPSWTNSFCLTHKQRCNMGWGKSKTNLEVLPASGRHLTPWQSPSLTYQHHCIWSRFSSASPITRPGSTTHSSFALSPKAKIQKQNGNLGREKKNHQKTPLLCTDYKPFNVKIASALETAGDVATRSSR